MKLVSKIFRRTDWYLSSGFGYRTVGGVLEFHSGTDYGTHKQNWNLYAIEQGVITSCGTAVDGAKYMWVNYPRLGKKLLHYHLDRIDVEMGQEVREGVLLGCAGETGSASGIHLHLGMQPSGIGSYEDPHAYDYNYPPATMSSDATVYGGPSTTLYAPIGSVIKTGKVEALERENNFLYIRYWTNKGLLKRGYVSLTLVKDSASIPVMDVTYKGNNSVVYPQSAVYSDPNMTTAEIGTVFEFEGVTQFTVQENGCYFIEYSTPTGAKRGYVQGSELIQKEGGLAIAPYGAEVYYTPRFEYKAGAIYANEYVTVLQSSGTTSYIEYNTKGGRKRGYVTNSSLHFLDTSNVPVLPNYTEESHKSTGFMTVYSGPSDKYAVIGSISEEEHVTRLSSTTLYTNNYAYIQYATADGSKRGYVVASGLVLYVPPVVDPGDSGDPGDPGGPDDPITTTNKYFTIKEDGSVEYKWYELTSLFGTMAFFSYPEADSVLSDDHYVDLLHLIDVMNVKKGEYIVLDTEALGELINRGYNNYVIGQDIFKNYVCAFKPHDGFRRLCELYQLKTDALLWENYSVIHDEPKESPKRQVLLAHMHKSALLMEMISRHGEIKRSGSEMKVMDYFPSGVTEVGIYGLHNDGFYKLGDGDGITLHEFNASNEKVIGDNIIGLAESFRRNKGLEIAAFSAEAILGILGTATSFIPVYGQTISATISGITFAYNIYKIAQANDEIDATNQAADEIKKDVFLERDFLIMQAGASIATYQNAVAPYNVSVNERNLQVTLCLYNDARPEEERKDRATLLADYYLKTKTGVETNLVWHFVNWCLGKIQEIEDHGDELQSVLSKYYVANPGCPYEKLSLLTPEQIIELDNEFRNPGNLVLKW